MNSYVPAQKPQALVLCKLSSNSPVRNISKPTNALGAMSVVITIKP